MSERQRKLAFVAAAAIVAMALAALARFGSEGQPDLTAPRPLVFRSRVVPDARTATRPGQGARVVAARFAVAYLARDSGHDTTAIRRALRSTATIALWEALRQPARIPPGTRPPRAAFERVSGLTETASPGTVGVTVAYRREGRRRYLHLVLVNEAGAWRASRFSP